MHLEHLCTKQHGSARLGLPIEACLKVISFLVLTTPIFTTKKVHTHASFNAELSNHVLVHINYGTANFQAPKK